MKSHKVLCMAISHDRSTTTFPTKQNFKLILGLHINLGLLSLSDEQKSELLKLADELIKLSAMGMRILSDYLKHIDKPTSGDSAGKLPCCDSPQSVVPACLMPSTCCPAPPRVHPKKPSKNNCRSQGRSPEFGTANRGSNKKSKEQIIFEKDDSGGS